jgi:hypothetical protein
MSITEQRRSDDETLATARHLHRPAMRAGDAAVWILGWTLGLSALWLLALGLAAVRGRGLDLIGPAALALLGLAQLALPGIGVLRPGGARAPVILRSATPLAGLWLVLVSTSSLCLGPPTQDRNPWVMLIGLGALATPFAGVPASYALFVGRGRWRSGALTVAAALLTVVALLSPVLICRATTRIHHHDGPVALGGWIAVGVAFGLASLVALRRARRVGAALSPASWTEGVATGGAVRLGDDLYPLPAALAGYEGPVCLYLPRVVPGTPSRGAHPLDPASVLPCVRAQLPLLLTDARDAALSLALNLATLGAAATAFGRIRGG